MIKAILACDGQGGIAKDGVMPWPRNMKDLKHFKQLTNGEAVLMGRKTWEAQDMPSPLPGRKNIVVTSDPNYKADGATVISSNINEHLTAIAEEYTVFVIGGAEIFKTLIKEISILHLSRISGNYDCDTFLPLDLIESHFVLIDSVEIDHTTRFETYFARKLHDLSIDTDIRQ